MIKEINFKETSLTSNIEINIKIEHQEIILNDKHIKINTDSFIDKIIRLTSSWKEEYINNVGLDKTSWTFILKMSDNKSKIYKGNTLPENYNELKKLLSGVTNELI